MQLHSTFYVELPKRKLPHFQTASFTIFQHTLDQRGWNPVFEGRGPAGFSVLTGRIQTSPRPGEPKLKFCPAGRSENPGAFQPSRTGSRLKNKNLTLKSLADPVDWVLHTLLAIKYKRACSRSPCFLAFSAAILYSFCVSQSMVFFALSSV